MPDNKQMKIQWITINGRQVPLVLPQTYSYADDDWKVTSDRDPLPIVEYGTTEGGVIVPKRVSDEGYELTQLTGSMGAMLREYVTLASGESEMIEVKPPLGEIWNISSFSTMLRMDSVISDGRLTITFKHVGETVSARRGYNILSYTLDSSDSSNQLIVNGFNAIVGKIDGDITTSEAIAILTNFQFDHENPLYIYITNTTNTDLGAQANHYRVINLRFGRV